MFFRLSLSNKLQTVLPALDLISGNRLTTTACLDLLAGDEGCTYIGATLLFKNSSDSLDAS
jgi:hypothetical protein